MVLVCFDLGLCCYIIVGFASGFVLLWFGAVLCLSAWVVVVVDFFGRLRLIVYVVNSVGHVHVLVFLLLHFSFVLFLCLILF